MKSFNLSEVAHRQQQSQKTGEKFSLSSVLSDLAGFRDIFIHHDILEPGRRSSSPHAHTLREEMVIVLEGTPTAWIGEKSHELKPGDLLGFPPGKENVHFVENRSQSVVKLIVVASNPAHDEVIYSS